MSHQLVQISGKRVVVVSRCRLARLPKTAAVIRNHAIPSFKQHWNLLFPRRAAERVSMNQNHWRAGTMIFVVKADRTRVFFSNINERHEDTSDGFQTGWRLLRYRWPSRCED